MRGRKDRGEKDHGAKDGAVASAAGRPRRRMGPGVRLLLAVAAGLVVAAAGLVALDVLLPGNGPADPSRIYDYVYADGKSENADFVLANMSDDSYLCLGSSEFYISKDKVSMCPQAVFGENVTGVDMTFVGQGYDQSLWQAIAAGAYGGRVKNKKVMIVVSPQWFFKGNGDQDKFESKFSYSLYRAFAQNPSISDKTKAYVRRRCEELGVDAGQLAAAAQDMPLDAVNDWFFSLADGWRLRSEVPGIVAIAPSKSPARAAGEPTGEPDWDALLDAARAEGAASCTTNDYGVYDAYWEKNHTYMPELFENFHEADDEYADLACLLEVCREAGLEPLVCILPVHGAWYDLADVSAEERAAYYQRIRGICDEAGAAYADFSSCEYEKYFLCDTVHPGWVGWVRIERAFYDFMSGRDDDFLGGADLGDAPGLAAEGGDS